MEHRLPEGGLNFPAVHLFQEFGKGGSDGIDHMQTEGLRFRDGDALADGVLGPAHVPLSFLADGPYECRGVVRGLGHHDRIRLLSDRHRMGGSDVGPGGHDGQMGGERDEDARRSGLRTLWIDEDDDRDGGGEEIGND